MDAEPIPDDFCDVVDAKVAEIIEVINQGGDRSKLKELDAALTAYVQRFGIARTFTLERSNA